MIRTLATISFLLLLATVTLWLRSHRAADVGAVFVNQGRAQAAASAQGKVYLFFSDLELGRERAWSIDYESGTLEEFTEVRDALLDTPAWERGALGFGLVKGIPTAMWVPANHWTAVIPHWFLTALFAILPLHWLLGRWRLRRRVKHRRCLQCGYDLRASTGRCPECGAPIEASSPATAPAA